jgi:sugar lactone lactonase YvrE
VWRVSAPRQVVTIGETLTLRVEAAGTPAPTFQWKRNGRPIPAATSSSYTITSASPARDSGWYQAVVANSSETVTTAVIFVNVAINPAQVLAASDFGRTQIAVPGDLNNVSGIAAGYGHWLVLKADGTVVAGGDNTYGQATVPAGLNNVVAITASYFSSVALRADGSLVVWGGSFNQEAAVPAGLTNVVSIAGGGGHTLALKADGTVTGWGLANIGPFPTLTNIVGISAGENNCFAWKADGTAVGWGNNAFGQASVPSNLTDVLDIASGEDFALALKTDGTVVGWGRGYSGADKVPVGLTNIVSIAAGISHGLALKADGGVIAWPSGNFVPLPAGATNVAAIAAKDAYCVVLRRASENAPVAAPEGTYIFTALAGKEGSAGNADGLGADARFNRPAGVALDREGNLFVADEDNHAIRKVTPAGVVTTFAGLAGQSGYANGPSSVARFATPSSVAVDTAGNIYVADAGNVVVRKVTAAGVVSTLAGTPGRLGSADGLGGAATFAVPSGIAVDRAGNIYVSDADLLSLADMDGNNTIRKITPEGVVSTLAGTAQYYGFFDATGAAARFGMGYVYAGLATDNAGNVYVADSGNRAVRKITDTGIVTTLAGKPGTPSAGQLGTPNTPSVLSFVAADSSGNVFVTVRVGIRKITPDGTVTTVLASSNEPASFRYASGIAVDSAGNLYVADSQNNVIYKGVPVPSANAEPAINRQPQSHTIALGGTVALTVEANGIPAPTFQWTKNGAVLPGATNATLLIAGAAAANAGNYACIVTNIAGSVTSAAATLAISSTANAGRVVNFSVRAPAGTGAQTLNVGLVVGGPSAPAGQPVLLRAIGPSLAAFGVTGFLADPKLELYSGPTKINENDNWGGDAQITSVSGRLGAFPLSVTTSKDAALYQSSLTAGAYTMVITGASLATGVALAEIYDATLAGFSNSAAPRLINVSVRTQVTAGGDPIIAGFVIGGETSKTLLVRASGPALADFGISGALYYPNLRLYSGAALLRENDRWGTATAANAAAFALTGAFPFASGSSDAALVVTLPPGAYTAQVTGGGGAGLVLLEVFDVPLF